MGRRYDVVPSCIVCVLAAIAASNIIGSGTDGAPEKWLSGSQKDW